MPEVEHFVNNMKQNMETDVMFVTADKTKIDNTQACHRHQQEWQKYKLDHSQSSLAGMK